MPRFRRDLSNYFPDSEKPQESYRKLSAFFLWLLNYVVNPGKRCAYTTGALGGASS